MSPLRSLGMCVCVCVCALQFLNSSVLIELRYWLNTIQYIYLIHSGHITYNQHEVHNLTHLFYYNYG